MVSISTLVAMLIHVVGASGGLGASVFSAALGLASVRSGHRAALVDLDPLGGGIDFVLACEQRPGLRWGELDPTGAPLDPHGLISSLLEVEGLAVLPQSEQHGCVSSAGVGSVTDALQAQCEHVVVDLPVELALVLPPEQPLLVLVASATCRGVRAADLTMRALERHGYRREQTVTVVSRESQRAMGAARVAESLQMPLGASWVRDERLSMAVECGDLRALTSAARGGIVEAAETVIAGLR